MQTRIKKDRTKKRHDRIREMFSKWRDKKNSNGKRIYSDEFIIDKIADNFLLSERYIDDIVNHRV